MRHSSHSFEICMKQFHTKCAQSTKQWKLEGKHWNANYELSTFYSGMMLAINLLGKHCSMLEIKFSEQNVCRIESGEPSRVSLSAIPFDEDKILGFT